MPKSNFKVLQNIKGCTNNCDCYLKRCNKEKTQNEVTNLGELVEILPVPKHRESQNDSNCLQAQFCSVRDNLASDRPDQIIGYREQIDSTIKNTSCSNCAIKQNKVLQMTQEINNLNYHMLQLKINN